MSVRVNAFANFLGQALSALLNLVFIPIYITYLGMEAYGLIGLLAAIQAWLTFFDLGITPTLNREMAKYSAGRHSVQTIRNLLASLEIICFVLALFFGIILWYASDYLANDWLKADKLSTKVVSEALSCIAFIVALRFIEGIYRGALLGLQRQVWLNLVSVTILAIRNGGAVLVLISISPSAHAFFIWQLIFSALTVLILATKVHLTVPRSSTPVIFSKKSIKDVWKFASGMIGIGFVALLLSQVDKLLLSRLLSLEAFGYYSLAVSIAGLSYVIVGSITTAVFPLMVQHSTPKEHNLLPHIYHQGAQLVTTLTAPFVMLLCIFPMGAIYAWSGDILLAQQTAPVLSVLALGYFLNGLMWMPYQCQISQGWTSLVLKGNILGVMLFVPAIFWVVPKYGAVGSAWIWVFINIGYILSIIPMMHRKTLVTEKWRWYIYDVLLPLLGTICVALMALFFQPAQYDNRLHWFLFLALVGVFAVSVSAMLASCIRVKILRFRWEMT